VSRIAWNPGAQFVNGRGVVPPVMCFKIAFLSYPGNQEQR
jgi:hypothetical protein